MLEYKPRFIQYELWKECKNGCLFCFNKGLEERGTKKEILDDVIERIKTDEIHGFNEIGFIGGEFFDGQVDDVWEQFIKLFQYCIDLVKKGIIKKIYFTTSLIYKNNQSLVKFLDYINQSETIDKFLLCTSFDTIGRFHTEKHLKYWIDNMAMITDKYPKLYKHTEIIMTQAFIDSCLNGEFDIKEFKEKYNTDIDFLEPNCGYYFKNKEQVKKVMQKFFPTRQSFINWVEKFVLTGVVDINRLFNRSLQSDTVFFTIDGKEKAFTNRNNWGTDLPCDIKIKSGYIDSNKVFMGDDVNFIKGNI